jgi:hypothetical protein
MVDHGILVGAQARVLKKLHKYRNDTYHRDELRPATLSSALKIYTYLVCTMLRDFSPFVISYGVAIPPTLQRYVRDDEQQAGFWTVGPELHQRIGAHLLNESGVGEPSQVGVILAQHVEDRLQAMQKDAAMCGGVLNGTRHGSGWDLDSIMCLVQIDPQRLRKVRTANDARAEHPTVRARHVEQWREQGKALADLSDDLAAFAAFADVEDAFEPIEALVNQFASDVDREIQLQIDIARGK